MAAGSRPTSAGLNIIAKALTGKTITFTRGAFGDSTRNNVIINPSDDDQFALTALINERMSLPISGVNANAGNAIVTLAVKNNYVTTTFQIREVGLFAKDPDTNAEVLYCYYNFGNQGFYIPAKSGPFIIEDAFSIVTAVGTAQHVTAVLGEAAFDYELPTASATTKGGIKVGSGLAMRGETLNVTMTAGETYTLPTASATTKGGIKVGSGLTMNGDSLSAAVEAKEGSLFYAGNLMTAGSGGYYYFDPETGEESHNFQLGMVFADYDGLRFWNGTEFVHFATGTTNAFAGVVKGVYRDGLMTARDKEILDNLNSIDYSLPTASATTKGGIKVGSGLAMNGETLNVTMTAGETYTLPTASATTKGGIKVGSGLTMNGDTLSAAVDSTLSDKLTALEARVAALEAELKAPVTFNFYDTWSGAQQEGQADSSTKSFTSFTASGNSSVGSDGTMTLID